MAFSPHHRPRNQQCCHDEEYADRFAVVIDGTSALDWRISRDEGAVLAELFRRPLKPIEISDIRSRPNLVMVYPESQEMKKGCDSSRPFRRAREIPVF